MIGASTVVLTLYLFTAIPPQQDEYLSKDDPRVPEALAWLEERLDREMSILELYLNDSEIDKNAFSLAKDTTLQRVQEAGLLAPVERVLDFGEIRKEVFNLFTESIGETLEGPSIQRYTSGYHIRKSFLREADCGVMVLGLDFHLALSLDQRVSIMNFLRKTWVPERGSIGLSSYWSGRSPRYFSKSQLPSISDVLSSRQRRAFKEISAGRINSPLDLTFVLILDNQSASEEVTNQWDQIVRDLCQRCVTLEIDRIQRVFELDQGKVKKLELSGRGACTRVHQEMKKELLSMIESTGFNQNNLPANEAAFPFRHVSSWFRKMDIWTKTVDRVLSDDQRSVYHDQLQKQLKFDLAIASKACVIAMTAIAPLSGEQRYLLSSIIERNTNSKSGEYYELFSSLSDIPEAEFRAVLSEEQWLPISASLGQLRNSILRQGK